MTGVRLDKWLWAARFFKARPLAVHACEMGRVLLNGHPAKPSREVQVGTMLQVRTPGGDFEVKVAALSDMRGPAAVAQGLYEETKASRAARAKAAAERHLMGAPPEALREGRPSKRDRREIDRLRRD